MTVETLDIAALDRLRRLGGENLLRQMIELYLTNGPDRIRSLTEGAAARDAAQVERAAHTLKSSAGNLGAARLQTIAEAVESEAAAGRIDEVQVAQLVRDYEASVDALRRALEERI